MALSTTTLAFPANRCGVPAVGKDLALAATGSSVPAATDMLCAASGLDLAARLAKAPAVSL